jgi:anti-anti-sigma factor
MSTQPINVTVEQDQATIALVGEHEAYSADKLARSLTGLIDEGVSPTVDLRRATFVDSTLIGVLIAASRRAEAAGLQFRVRLGEETGWAVRRLLDITGLAAPLDVVG